MSVFKKLGEGIADLAELNVQTFTGTLTTQISQDGGNLINWVELLAEAKKTGGEVTLVASSRIKLDGDCDMYFDKNVDEKLLQTHIAAVDAGQKIRLGIMDAFKDVLGLSKP